MPACHPSAARHREVGGEQGFVIHLDEERVIAGGRERKIADFVDEVDALQRSFGRERPFEERLHPRWVQAHRDAHLVFTWRAIRDGEKPDHERVRDWKLARLNIREHAEDSVLPGARIDVDAIASYPGEELRL
jgi:hypothetical protein